MVPINDVSDRPFYINDPRNPEATEKSVGNQIRNSGKLKESTTSGNCQDRVELSDYTRNNMRKSVNLDPYIDLLKKAPVLREKDLEKIKSRMVSGFYQKPEVVDKILDTIIQTAGSIVGNADTGMTQSAQSSVGSSSDMIEDIQKKIQGDFYNSDEVLNKIVDRIIDEE